MYSRLEQEYKWRPELGASPAAFSPPASLCRARSLTSMCLASISRLYHTPDRHSFNRADPGERPKLALKVSFQAVWTGNFWKHLLLPLIKLYCLRQWGNL